MNVSCAKQSESGVLEEVGRVGVETGSARMKTTLFCVGNEADVNKGVSAAAQLSTNHIAAE